MTSEDFSREAIALIQADPQARELLLRIHELAPLEFQQITRAKANELDRNPKIDELLDARLLTRLRFNGLAYQLTALGRSTAEACRTWLEL